MTRISLFIPLTALILSVPACSQAQPSMVVGKSEYAKTGNYVTNGNFEKAMSGAISDWKITGDVKPQAASGVWKRLTAKFRTGANRTVGFYFYVLKGATGSVWVDNIQVDPKIDFKNPSFENFGVGGVLQDWRTSNAEGTVFADSSRATAGKQSVRITHEHEAVSETFLLQDIAVEPGKEYSISFDIFIGADFQGEAKGWLFNDNHENSLDFEYENLIGSKLLEDRDRLGKVAVTMNPTAASPATITQELTVAPGSNLLASLDLQNNDFKGIVQTTVEDAATGKTLYEKKVSESQVKWQSISFPFQNAAPKIRINIHANGEGSLRLDNIAITPPRVVPPLQQVNWLPATQNFKIPSRLQYSVKGKAGQVIEGGIGLLNKDLKPHGITLQKISSATNAALQIFIGPQYAAKSHGDEAYSLTVNGKRIVIKAAEEGGAFYGLMTLLQLIDKREGKAVFLPCNVTDYPDMPMRGFLYGDEEQAARWKMNTLMVSTGYPVTPAARKEIHDLVKKCQSLNLQFIPYFLSLEGGYYVQGINPNLAAGVWVKDEKLTLKGTESSPLANPYVIRTTMSDIKLTSADGAKTYQPGTDYRVIDGEMNPKYDDPNARRFAIARLPGSAIADGDTVLASYDWVSHQRDKYETHIAYVPLEPETEKLMSEFLTGLAKDFPLTYIHTSSCLHEFGPADHQLRTDSRVIKSGKKPIELLVEDTLSQNAAIKKGNPKARLVQWTGNVGEYAKAAAPHLPKDALVNIWGYDASWPSAYGREAVEYWTKLGYETSVMSWDNLQNIRGWAQVVAEARRKGNPCQGIIGSTWGERNGGFQETAIVAWKIPKKGEPGYVALPAMKPTRSIN